jgi:S1-C subfamily serine protease
MNRKKLTGGRALGLALLALTAAGTARVTAQELDATARQRMYYEAKPAVVYIWAVARANISVVGPFEATVEGLIIPDRTLLVGMEAVVATTGSGWIITPDGYVVTNGHVAQLFQEENEQQLMEELFYQALEESGFFAQEEAERGGGDPNAVMTHDRKIRLMQRLLPFTEMQIDKDLWVYTQNWREYAAEVKEYSPPIYPFQGTASTPGMDLRTGKDVAILKIEGRDLPTLVIGDSDAMRIGENVHLAGYPGVTRAAFYGQLNPETEVEASFTRGGVSSVKMDVKGSTVIQYDAATSAGHSGGPLLNDGGEVIGMATMGAEPGFFFAVPTSVINEFVRSAGVTPARGMFDRDWTTALDAYYAEDWGTAIAGFDQALRVMPDLRDAVELRREAMISRDAAPVPPPGGGIGLLPTLVGAVALIGLALLAWGYAIRRRPAVAGAAAGTPAISASPADAALPSPQIGLGRLVVRAGPLQGNRFPVSAAGLRIGRDPSTCQVVITEGTVSREHAIVLVSDADSGVLLKNLSGTNPTYVNDRAVQEAALHDGDRIKIGSSILHFERA